MTMLLESPAFQGFCEQALAILVDSASKGVILLTLAWLIVLGMRHSSAAARHLVWVLALGGLLLLPALSLMLPKWQLPILPRTPRLATLAPTAPAQPIPVITRIAPPEAPIIATPEPPRPTASIDPKPIITTAPSQPTAPPLPLGFWLIAAWVTVVVAALVPLCTGFVFLGRLIRRAAPLEYEPWPTLLRSLSERLGLRRRVRMLRTNSFTMPMAVGVWRPTILLPSAAETWSEEKCQAVLLHELAHIRRWDCLTHILTRLACVAHWFNPLAWLALKKLQNERERACDDLVLTAGARPVTYAEELLDIARTMHTRAATSVAAIPMARESQLEGRLLAILDATRNRRRVTLWAVCVSVFTFLFTVATLAAVQLDVKKDKRIDNKMPTAISTSGHSLDKLSFPSGMSLGKLLVIDPAAQSSNGWLWGMDRIGKPFAEALGEVNVPKNTRLALALNSKTLGSLGALDKIPAGTIEMLVGYDIPLSHSALEALRQVRPPTGLFLHQHELSTIGAAQLATLESLKGLRISNSQLITTATMAKLGRIKGLEHLFLEWKAVDSRGLIHLAKLPVLRRLDLLNVSYGAALHDLAKFPALEQLGIRNFDGPGLQDLKLPPTCKTLSLSGSGHYKEQDFAGIERLSGLESLSLNYTIPDAAVPHLKALKTLKHLSLSFGAPGVFNDRALSDVAAEHLADIKTLETLTLAYGLYTDHTLKLLAMLPQLKYLSIPNNQGFTESGLEYLKRAPALEELGLRGYGMGKRSDGTFGIVNEFTDRALLMIEQFPSLKKLTILARGKITDAGLKRLKQRRPGLTVEIMPEARMPQVTNRSKAGASITANAPALRKSSNVLQELDLSQSKDSDAELATRIAASPNLSILRLNHTQAGDKTLAAIGNLKDLHWLDLQYTTVTQAGLAHLARLSQLKALFLDFTQVNDNDLATIKGLTSLTNLGLGYTHVTDEGLKNLAGMKRLAQFSVYHCPITDAGLHEIKLLPIESLELGATPVTDRGLLELREMKSLRSLSLHMTRITNEGLKTLGAMTWLDSLGIGAINGVTDAGLPFLESLKQLKWLSVYQTDIDDAAIATLSRFPRLEYLDVADTFITQAGVAKLREALGPRVEIKYFYARRPEPKNMTKPTAAAGDINAKIATLDIDHATLEDILRVFGNPSSYYLWQRQFTKDKLPTRYFMAYPDGVDIQMANGRLRDLRISKTNYVFPGGIRVGTPTDEALATLPKPDDIIERDLTGIRDKVLYKNIMADQGWHFYSRPDRGAWFMFANGKVLFITLVPRDFTIANPALEEAIQKIETRYRSVGGHKLRLEYDWTWDVTQPKALPLEKRVMMAWRSNYREETKDKNGRTLFHYFHNGLRADITPDEKQIRYHSYSFVHNVDTLIPAQWAESPRGIFANERMLGGGLPPEHRTINGLDCVRISEMFFAPGQDWAFVADGFGVTGPDSYRVQVREFMKSGNFVFPRVIREGNTELAITRLVDADPFDPKMLEFPQPSDGWQVAFDCRVWSGDAATQKLNDNGVSPTSLSWHIPLMPTERRQLIVSLADWKIEGRLDPEANHYPRPFYNREHDHIVWALYDRDHQEYRTVFIGDDLPANYGPAPWLKDLAHSPDVAAIVNAVYQTASKPINAPRPGNIKAESSFPLNPLAIEVRLHDAQGRPPAQAGFGLLRQAPPGWQPPAENTVDALNFKKYWTDPATGITWLFDGYSRSARLPVLFKRNYSGQPLSPGRYRMTALVDENASFFPFPELERRGAFALSEPFQIGGQSQTSTTTVELKLETGNPFTLRVLDSVTRRSVAGARLLLRRPDGLPVAPSLNECLSAGTNGELRFSSLAPGRYTLEISTDWSKNMPRYHKREGVAIEVPAGNAGSAEVLLEPTAYTASESEKNWPYGITGKVTDRDGRPMENVWIELDMVVGNHSWVPGRTFTGPDGRYTMRFALPDPNSALYYRISANREGFKGQVQRRDEDAKMFDENTFTELSRGKPRQFDFVMAPK